MSNLEITEIHINVTKKIESDHKNPLMAFVRIVLNGCFVINGIKVIQGRAGVFISFPREYDKETKTGNNICYPIRKDVHEQMSAQILKEYDAAAGRPA